MYTPTQLQQQAKELITLKEVVRTNGSSVKERMLGICSIMRETSLRPMFYTWEHYSGEKGFPVFDATDEEEETPQNQFFSLSDLWVGKQLELRLSLCKHIINQLENK